MSQIILTENSSAPSTPVSGSSEIYPKADGLWYSKDDAGIEKLMSSGPGGITQLTGDVTAGSGSGSQAAIIPGLSLVDDGNSGTTKTIDWLSLKVGRHELTLTGNVTLTLNNPVDGGVYVLLIHTGAGSFTVTWPASVLWPGGVAPVITVTASKTDLVTLIYDSSAAKYYGSFNQNY